MIVPANKVNFSDPPFRFTDNRFGFLHVPSVLNAHSRVGRQTWSLDRVL